MEAGLDRRSGGEEAARRDKPVRDTFISYLKEFQLYVSQSNEILRITFHS